MADQKEMKKRLKVLMNLPENQVCSDCNERQPRWASLIVPPPGAPEGSLAIGAFCCLECSGSHRRLGVHISFVRSINLDSWKEKEVLAMENGGNAKVNAIFEAHLARTGVTKPTNHADGPTRERFIRDKYERRKFYDAQAFEEFQLPAAGGAAMKHQEDIVLPALDRSVGPPSDAARRRMEERKNRKGGQQRRSHSREGKPPAPAPAPAPAVDLLDLGGPLSSGHQQGGGTDLFATGGGGGANFNNMDLLAQPAASDADFGRKAPTRTKSSEERGVQPPNRTKSPRPPGRTKSPKPPPINVITTSDNKLTLSPNGGKNRRSGRRGVGRSKSSEARDEILSLYNRTGVAPAPASGGNELMAMAQTLQSMNLAQPPSSQPQQPPMNNMMMNQQQPMMNMTQQQQQQPMMNMMQPNPMQQNPMMSHMTPEQQQQMLFLQQQMMTPEQQQQMMIMMQQQMMAMHQHGAMNGGSMMMMNNGFGGGMPPPPPMAGMGGASPRKGNSGRNMAPSQPEKRDPFADLGR